MSPPELRVVDDLAEAGEELFLEAGPRTVALAGGSTPRPVYERLAGIAYPWEEVDVFFGDERCVPSDHPESNYGMAKAALLDLVDARVHPMHACDPEAYEREKDIFRSQAIASGKPANIAEKMVEGKMAKFYEEVCLYEQPFIKDQTISISQLITTKIGKLGENISVRRFARFKVGDAGETIAISKPEQKPE